MSETVGVDEAPAVAPAEQRSRAQVERALLYLLLAGIAVGCLFVLRPFLSAVAWAMILAFTTWPLFRWTRERVGGRGGLAATAMVLVSAVVIVLPLAVAIPSGADDVNQLRKEVQTLLQGGLPGAPTWMSEIPLIGPTLFNTWNGWADDLASLIDVVRPYFGWAAEQGFGLMLGFAGGVAQVLIALFIAWFLWAGGDGLATALRAALFRIGGPQGARLLGVTGATVRGTVYGLIGTAVVQGLLTWIGLWASGVPRPVLLGVIAGLISVLPIGAPVIWLPAGLWLLSTGSTGWGIALLVWGFFVISGSDNIIRPYFIARGANLPFLITVLGVLGGAVAFGLLGIFLGPVLLGVGYTLAAEFARGPAPGVGDQDKGGLGSA